jgi:hypothetical protein
MRRRNGWSSEAFNTVDAEDATSRFDETQHLTSRPNVENTPLRAIAGRIG